MHSAFQAKLPSVPGDKTYQDLALLREDVRAEILDGELYVTPSSLPRHSKVQRGLASFLGRPFDDDDGRGGPGGWWILLEVDIQLGEHDVVRPDVLGYRRERLPDPWDTRPLSVVPDWICEVTSPSNARVDRVLKRSLYAKAGVGHYWIIDPHERVLEVLRLEGASWLEVGAYDHTSIARIEPFRAIELELSRLFPPE
ncbi:MAG: Uma2 family endonuclease [Polyangiaceae bacterium]